MVCASFAIRFPDTKLPFKSTIKRIVDRFRETGSVNDRKKQIKPRKITAEKIKKIKEQVIQNDGFVSVRDLSKHENIGLSPSSVHTVLKEHLKIHPYKPTKEHKHLLSSDLGKRRQFCQWSIYEVTDDGLPEMTFNATKSMSTDNNIRKFETLHISVPAPFVYHVELNRPNKRNAMSHTMWLELKECFDSLSIDENCRSIVLSGNGAMFCAGIDLQCFMDMSQNFKESDDVARRAEVMYRTIKLYQNSLSSLEKCVKPVISAVHSACIGGGINMICSADIRYCTTDAWFQIKEIDLGMAADVGVLQRLPRIIGSASLTRELVFTGRKFLADEAEKSGFVNRVFSSKEELFQESIKTATEIASKSPVAVQTAKKSLIYSQDHTVEEGLEHLAIMNQTMLQSEDLMAAIMAQASKSPEPPVFSKL